MNTTYIDRVESWQTGGNVMVDIVHLKDGRLLGINDELVVLYQNEDEFWESSGRERLPQIELGEETYTGPNSQTFRLYFPGTITLDSVRQFLLQLEDQGMLYHIDDNPFEVYTSLNGPRLFTDTECYALIGFWNLVRSRLSWDEVWEEAFPKTNTD